MRAALLTFFATALWLPTAASAFCGTFIGGAGSELYNHASQLVVAREGDFTTLTLVNDVESNTVDFAMVVPVPQILGPEDVRTIDPSHIGVIDRYTSPRLVEYTCEDYYPHYGYEDEFGGVGCGNGGFKDDEPNYDTGASALPEDAYGVDIEAEFAAGEYDIVVLSAEESGGLLLWLTDNGYAVSGSASDMLQEYIDAGSYFFAAKVNLENVPSGQEFLSPIQFTYLADSISIPVQLGTLNSPGEQDLIIYVIGNYAAGVAGISNYPEVQLEDECMFKESDYDDFGQFYQQRARDAFDDNEGASWILEYAWGAAGCDPCVGDPPDDETVRELGFGDSFKSVYDMYVTRLHMRYRPGQIDQDVSIYLSGVDEQAQGRYILYKSVFESEFPICGEGWSDNPGSCFGPVAQVDDAVPLLPWVQSTAPAFAGVFVLGLAALRRRR